VFEVTKSESETGSAELIRRKMSSVKFGIHFRGTGEPLINVNSES
jgi:hypothetical protein